MRPLVGPQHQTLLENLFRQFDAVKGGDGPLIVSLESALGLGKTRLVQELYGRLASQRQGPVPYWPPSIAGDIPDLLQARKQVAPPPGWTVAGNASIPWLWWGITCQPGHASMPMRNLRDASDQLRPHMDPLLAMLQRGDQRREDAVEVLSGVLDLVGLLNPLAAFEAGDKFMGVWRRRRAHRKLQERISVDRRIEVDTDDYLEAVRVGESLTAVARAGTPVVLVVDDAQWADPALVSVLRHLTTLDAVPVLIITTAWTDRLAERTGPETFSGWLHETGLSRGHRLERVRVDPLTPDDLHELILDRAPRTERSAVAGIAKVASGNPLVLNLVLDLDVIRRDIADDGRIDTPPETLDRLPSDVRAIYQDLWRDLPDGVRRVLAVVALQGPEFLPGIVPEAATGLRMYDELTSAFARARDVHGWIRDVNADRCEFSERQRFDVAFDVISELFDDDQQDLIRAAVIDHIIAIKRSARWPDLDLRTRRTALESHLELNEQRAEDADRDLEDLADSMVQLASLELDAANGPRAVELADHGHRLTVEMAAPEATVVRARAILAQALATVGRADEALPLLAELAAEPTAGEELDAGFGELMSELSEELSFSEAEPTLPEAGDFAAADLDEWGRRPWKGWSSRPVPTLTSLAPSEIAELIQEVVASEGPVLAARVYTLLRLASGAAREGRQIRAALDRGLSVAVKRGDVVSSIADERGRSERRLLRLSTQPEMDHRQVGERGTWELPGAELVELGRRVMARDPHLSRVELKRAMSRAIGWQRYTQPLDDLLESVLPSTLAGSTDDGAGGPSGDDPIRARAAAARVAEAYDAFVEVARRTGLGERRTTKTLALTPPSDRRMTLVYLQPTDGGQLHFGYNADVFQETLKVPAADVIKALLEPWVNLTVDEGMDRARRLSELLASPAPAGRT